MSETMIKKINYIVACINEFSKATGLDPQEAYRYLNNHHAIAFLNEHYDVEHTLSMEDAVDDLKTICRHNGGNIA